MAGRELVRWGSSNPELDTDGVDYNGGPEVSCRDVDYGVQERRASWHKEEKSSSNTVCRVVEVLVLCAIVLGLLGLYMIPTIYFANPPLQFQPVSEIVLEYCMCKNKSVVLILLAQVCFAQCFCVCYHSSINQSYRYCSRLYAGM